MIYFTLSEIFSSVLASVIYGFIFALLHATIRRISLLPDTIYQIFKKCTFSDFINSPQKFSGRFMIFLLVTTYALGIILLSYSFLDGMLRVYMIALSLLCYKLTLKVAFSLIDVLVFVMLRVILHPFTKFWRRNT